MNKVFKTAMIADYFTEDELIKKTGISKNLWNFVILKELIDNALDAIEPLKEKYISVNMNEQNKSLKIFDNGIGISLETIDQIYDFSIYVSKNRHFVTPSRGKQGNGLKTIISICYLMGYRLLWHSSDGVIRENIIDASEIENGTFRYQAIEQGKTTFRGIEIIGYDDWKPFKDNFDIISRYSICNKDVSFHFDFNGLVNDFVSTECPNDKSKGISISFYDYHTFMRLIRDTQDGNTTYKAFLGDLFGTRIKNESSIRGKIKEIDFESKEVKEDFLHLKAFQQSKRYTILKNHAIGLKYSMNTEILVQKSSDDNSNTYVPCIVEFDVEKIDIKNDKRYWAECKCFINNTITYSDSWSIVFNEGYYELGMRKCNSTRNLAGLLEQYNDYKFVFHFISPYFVFKDAGKTEIDISSFISELCRELKKAMSKEKKKYDSKIDKPIQNTDLLRPYMDEAFNLASTNGKYAITARQMWYKIREISGAPDEAYSAFTQTVLTEWISNHPNYEDKINFANRGVFYIGSKQDGLGTANVRNFVNGIDKSPNIFSCYGGVNDNIFIEENFNVEYQYDKVLYIEKTGFDDIFKAEKVGEKYHMIIVSGQGFPTRAAKTILYTLQQKGLKLYCMHDLDISGVNIYKSFQNANDKFEYAIDIEDLGVTLEDVKKYKIRPEQVKKGDNDKNNLATLSKEYQEFFNGGTFYNRVELNAFTTEQILEIMSSKLLQVNSLPTIDLESTFEVNHDALRDVAFMRVIGKKYRDKLSDIYIPCDLSEYSGKYTVEDAKEAIPEIKDRLIERYEKEIEKKLNIL